MSDPALIRDPIIEAAAQIKAALDGIGALLDLLECSNPANLALLPLFLAEQKRAAAALTLIRAQVLEEAAHVVEEVATIYDARLEQGKGEHCKPGYVRDDTWNQWLGKYSITTELAAAIRALKEQP